MKSILLSNLAFSLVFSLSSANTPPLGQNSHEGLGRQCCTKTTFMADGSSVSISACAGWVFSNDANAMARACSKVNEAMGLLDAYGN